VAAPCINETCSITAMVDPITRRLELEARIDPQGGLICNDGLGLAARVFGGPPAADPVDQCFQQLGTSVAGELWSVPKRAKTVLRTGEVVNIPQVAGSAGSPQNSFSGDQAEITNPFSCEAEMLVVMQYRIGFTISLDGPDGDHLHPVVTDAAVSGGNAGVMIPYGMQVQCRTDSIGAGGNFVDAVSFVEVGGLAPDLLDNTNHRVIQYAVSRRRIGANATVNLDARASHIVSALGDVHWYNVTTVDTFGSVPAFDDRGFQATALAYIFPFNSEDA